MRDIPDKNALTATAYFHAKLENIHPFADGNGRLGRLLMNYILVCHDHPPVIVFEEDRREYYTALELAPLENFLMRQCEKSWSRYLERQTVRENRGHGMEDQLASAIREAEQRNAKREKPTITTGQERETP